MRFNTVSIKFQCEFSEDTMLKPQHMVSWFSTTWRTAHLFSIVAVWFYIPTQTLAYGNFTFNYWRHCMSYSHQQWCTQSHILHVHTNTQHLLLSVCLLSCRGYDSSALHGSGALPWLCLAVFQWPWKFCINSHHLPGFNTVVCSMLLGILCPAVSFLKFSPAPQAALSPPWLCSLLYNSVRLFLRLFLNA